MPPCHDYPPAQEISIFRKTGMPCPLVGVIGSEGSGWMSSNHYGSALLAGKISGRIVDTSQSTNGRGARLVWEQPPV